MTASDVRTAAQTEAERIYPYRRLPDANMASQRDGFVNGAVWGAAYVTPTREQIARALWEAEPRTPIPWELAPEAARSSGYVLADAVLALLQELSEEVN